MSSIFSTGLGGGGGGGTTTTIVTITSSDFAGNDYTNALFGSATAYEVFSNSGSGTLLSEGVGGSDSYTVSGNVLTLVNGTLPDNYKIFFYS